jgi:hypothetical protein
MNYKTIVTDVVLILICVLPFLIFAYNKKKKKSKLLGKIKQPATGYGLKISKYDIWDQSIIGLDESNSHVFFYRFKQGNETFKHIKIDEIRSCDKQESSRTIAIKNGSVKVIEKLALVFYPRLNHQATISLEFYDTEDSSQLGNELILIEQWQSTLSVLLNQKKQNEHRHAG